METLSWPNPKTGSEPLLRRRPTPRASWARGSGVACLAGSGSAAKPVDKQVSDMDMDVDDMGIDGNDVDVGVGIDIDIDTGIDI